MTAPKEIERLIERFQENRDVYCSSQYNEAQARIEFIDPFFRALGWDMTNEKGYAEAYKEVIHEDAIKVGGATKAPDYAFRIGGVRKFFVEAKRPGLNIKEDGDAAYQLRRYAWSAKLPLSIVTDFEEFAVYDCRIKPAKTDKASLGRVLYLTVDEYNERWDEIAAIFSQDAILTGSFDKYVQSTKKKRGTAEVDTAFLKEIEAWRDVLARNIALRNAELSTRELNFAVQRTIDRIIFLRICEDRGIEDYGQLMALQNGTNTYQRLCQIFRRADERYNSGLFHFTTEKDRLDPPDNLTLNLAIDDNLIKGIIKGLYYPESPFEFSVLPADILGHIYEQFLGKVIRLTPGHHAKVEDKPEVKKAGGVYYTPTYIVDYMVNNTVGKLLEQNTPTKASNLRILDPACGSGSFLLGAYQTLLDWHQEWYTKHDPEKHAKGRSPKIYLGPGGEWRLTTPEKKRILLNNIYGVDIDTQAVEVTKLSLLLKVLEGENAETLGKNLRLFHERALPDLGDNIKCGNSLIGPDFYEGKQISLLDEEERYRINAFDWNAEFPEIMAAGAFDAVIGNPPYVRSQTLGPLHRHYYNCRYHSATGTYDIYVLFVELTLELLNEAGRAGFILPNKFFTTDYGFGLRGLLLKKKVLEALVDFEDAQVFPGSGTYTTLLFLSSTYKDTPKYAALGSVYKEAGVSGLAIALTSSELSFGELSLPLDSSRWTLATGRIGTLLTRLGEQFPSFSSLDAHIFQGLKTSADKLYLVTQLGNYRTYSEVLNGFGERFRVENEMLQPAVRGEHVQRYFIDTSVNLFIIYPYSVGSDGKASLKPEDELRDHYPLAWAYLMNHRKALGARDKGKWSKRIDWYAYARSQNIGAFAAQKLMIPYMANRLRASLDECDNLFFVNITTGGYGMRVSRVDCDYRYILGLLNSRLLNLCATHMTNRFRGGYFAFNKQVLERLPFPSPRKLEAGDKGDHDGMVELVDIMLKLHKDLQAVKTDHEKSLIQRQIDATDKQIDQLVYELYGLTKEEVKIVEEESQKSSKAREAQLDQ